MWFYIETYNSDVLSYKINDTSRTPATLKIDWPLKNEARVKNHRTALSRKKSRVKP